MFLKVTLEYSSSHKLVIVLKKNLNVLNCRADNPNLSILISHILLYVAMHSLSSSLPYPTLLTFYLPYGSSIKYCSLPSIYYHT